MYNHEPEGYDCPFRRLVRGLDTKVSGQDDVVYRDDQVTAFMSVGWWPNNPGHVLVVPNEHHENIYDLPPELGTPIQRVAREIALAFKETYECAGVSMRQHSEPAGNQDVWYYHLHILPRYQSDDLYNQQWRRSTPEERRPYADKLRGFLVARAGWVER